jgi:hypothetical protein
LQTHDPLQHGDFSEQLLADGQGEADPSALAVTVLGGGIVLKAGEALMEPQERGKVLVLGLRDQIEHGRVALDEGARPAAEPREVRVRVEIKEMGGFEAVRRGFEAKEIPHMAGAPASYRANDLEGIRALFIEPGAVAALSATGAGSIQTLIAGIGLTEAQANQDSRLRRIDVLAQPSLCWSDLKVPCAPAEFRVRRGQAAGEHLSEEAPLRGRGNVNGVQVNF